MNYSIRTEQDLASDIEEAGLVRSGMFRFFHGLFTFFYMPFIVLGFFIMIAGTVIFFGGIAAFVLGCFLKLFGVIAWGWGQIFLLPVLSLVSFFVISAMGAHES